MKFGKVIATSAFIVLLIGAHAAIAQVQPTAVQDLQLSAFGAIGGAYTGFGGRNLSVTAGADLGVRLFDKYLPSLEIRGSYPVDKGQVAGAKELLGGIKVERAFHDRYHPYGDVLYGRTEFAYQNGGYPNPAGTYQYTMTASNTYCFGGGGDIDITRHLSAKGDFQYEHNSVPVTTSNTIWTRRISAGVVYRFDFRGHKFFNREHRPTTFTVPQN